MEREARAAFPLVPRHRLTGLPFGAGRSTRRGRGSDLAGTRAYVPGDPISTIDWRASARLSTARGDDEFVVREHFADEAARVVVVADRRPSMALYPDWSPWLSKPAAARAASGAIVESAVAARGAAGYLDFASGPGRAGEPYWIAPRGRSPFEVVDERLRDAGFDADGTFFERTVEHLTRAAPALGAGSFVFVLSDFLEPPQASFWLEGMARRWELVPVVIQDPIWEQSFPSIGAVTMPVADPVDGAVLEVRLSRSEAGAERERRAKSRTDLLASLAALALDPVLLDGSDSAGVRHAFHEWAARRRRALWQRR